MTRRWPDWSSATNSCRRRRPTSSNSTTWHSLCNDHYWVCMLTNNQCNNNKATSRRNSTLPSTTLTTRPQRSPAGRRGLRLHPATHKPKDQRLLRGNLSSHLHHHLHLHQRLTRRSPRRSRWAIRARLSTSSPQHRKSVRTAAPSPRPTLTHHSSRRETRTTGREMQPSEHRKPLENQRMDEATSRTLTPSTWRTTSDWPRRSKHSTNHRPRSGSPRPRRSTSPTRTRASRPIMRGLLPAQRDQTSRRPTRSTKAGPRNLFPGPGGPARWGKQGPMSAPQGQKSPRAARGATLPSRPSFRKRHERRSAPFRAG